MSRREFSWVIFLAGLPFAHFLFRPLDLWHGQALWAQGWIVLLMAYSLGQSSKHLTTRANVPLGWFVAWVGMMSLVMWVNAMKTQNVYPIALLPYLMHLLLLVWFYQAAMMTWTVEFLTVLLRWMARAGVIVIVYCFLQALQLDQFLKSVDNHSISVVVGTIGNPSHLAIQLAILIPLFLLQNRWYWKGWALVAFGLLLMTHSAGGQVSALIALWWWALRRQQQLIPLMALFTIIVLLFVVRHPTTLNPFGRFEAWAKFNEFFRQQPITGMGPGFIMEISKGIPKESVIYHWRHTHCEFFQIAIEYGLIGFGLISWLIVDAFKRMWTLPQTPLVVALSCMLIAFFVNAWVNFPAHLWQIGSYALVAYCGLQMIEPEPSPCQL
jgi:hypothetical protein